MSRMCHKRVVVTVFLIMIVLSSGWVSAASYPSATGYINDFANVLDQRSKAELQVIADKLQKEQGIELAVVTISTSEPLDPKSYITGLFNEWGVGGPEDSGLMILLSLAEGAIEVEPGYGLEGALPDGLVGAVIDQEGLDHFKDRDYGTGLVKMSSAYANILVGEEFEIKEDKVRSGGNGWLNAFIIFMLIIILTRRARRKAAKNSGEDRGGTGGTGSTGGGVPRPIIVPRTTSRVGTGSTRSSSRGFGGGRSGGGGAGRRF